ncbi:MAG: OmpA family protein [Cytophagaceae bacterium]
MKIFFTFSYSTAFVIVLLTVSSVSGQTHQFYFKTGSYKLTSIQEQQLDSLLETLEPSLAYYKFNVSGHTDSIGARSYNEALSRNRSMSVASYLLGHGVGMDKILVKWFAFSDPKAPNLSEKGRSENRRTALLIEPVKADPEWILKQQVFKVPSSKNTILTTDNGCQLRIKKNSFVTPHVLTSDTVDLKIIEYNAPGDFIAAGIPMSFTSDGELHMYNSHQMFSLSAWQNGREIQLKEHSLIELHCGFIDTTYEIGFYKFNVQNQAWSKIETVSNNRVKVEEEETPVSPVAEQQDATNNNQKNYIGGNKPVDQTNFLKAREIVIDTGKGRLIRIWNQAIDVCAFLCSDLEGHLGKGDYYSRHGYLFPSMQIRKRFLSRKYTMKLASSSMFIPRELRSLKWISHYNPAAESYIKRGGKKQYLRFSLRIDTLEKGGRYVEHLSFAGNFSWDPRIKYGIPDSLDPYKSLNFWLRKERSVSSETLNRFIKIYNDSIKSKSCFWMQAFAFMKEKEKSMSLDEWTSYFNENEQLMVSRYQGLIKRGARELYVELDCMDSCRLRKYRYNQGGSSPLILIGSGYYNFDEIFRKKQRAGVDYVSYTTTKGKPVYPISGFLMIPSVNGMVRIDNTKSLNLIANTINTLLLLDEYGHRYLVRIDAAQLPISSAIVVEDVTDKTRTLIELNKVLSGR